MENTIPITVTITKRRSTTITKRELAWAIMYVVVEKLGGIDDAGCDWLVNWETDNGYAYGIFIGSPEWHVSEDEHLMTLVDAANILHYGNPLNLQD